MDTSQLRNLWAGIHLFFFLSLGLLRRPFFIFVGGGRLDVLCKNCVFVKDCKDKDKPPRQLCERYTDFADTNKFRVIDKFMRQNKAVWLE